MQNVTQNTDENIITSEVKLSGYLLNPSWMHMLIAALAYFALAYFSTRLDIPDRYNLLIGLPAGLAFILFVTWGLRLWPYMWLGAFAADLLLCTGGSAGAGPNSAALLTAFLTASGAIAQALVGVRLVHLFVKQPVPLVSTINTVFFLFLAGPIACLVSSTVNTFALYQFYALPATDILSTWITGYTHDTMGVLLLAPIILLARPCMRAGDGWRLRIVVFTSLLFGMAVLLLVGLFFFNQNEVQNTRNIFEEKASELAYRINKAIYFGENRLHVISGLINSSGTVTSAEFAAFNESFELPPGITALSWAQREATKGADRIFKHQLIYPNTNEVFLQDVDLARNIPVIALLRAEETGFRALTMSTNDSGIQDWWLIYPVYTHRPSERKAIDADTLRGFAVARMDMLQFFAEFIDKANDLKMALRVKGVATWHPSMPIIEHNVPIRLVPDSLHHLNKGFAGFGLQLEMWDLNARQNKWTLGSVMFICFGMLSMMLVSVYALSIIGYGFHLERKMKQRTAEMKIQNAKTNALVEHLREGAITIDENGAIHSVNPAIKRIFGYTAAELIGSKISLLIPEVACAADYCYLDNHLHVNKEHIPCLDRQVLGYQKHGDAIPIHMTLSAYSANDCKYLSGTLRDLREQIHLMTELESERDKAKAASQAKSEFLAAMSHEIRTPMNGVIGMLDVLVRSSLEKQQAEMIELVRESAYALLDVINDILDFSKIEAGKLLLAQDPMSVEEVTEKVCSLLDRMAEQKQVELTLFVDPEIPCDVQGDALRLRQILYNLINNAIKFSSRSQLPGKVAMRVRLISREEGRVWIEFAVIDNGIGISEAIQSRLFSPFEQGESSTTRRFGGTGLGLAISRQLSSRMGGEITVQSAPNKGSTFFVRLPFTVLPSVKQAEASCLTGLSCLVIGPDTGFTADIVCYLSAVGAQAQRSVDIDTTCINSTIPFGNPWVWLLNTESKSPLDKLRVVASQYPQKDIRFVVISRGKRRKPRFVEENLLMIDANVLTRHNLLHTVAIAAGLADAEEVRNNKHSQVMPDTFAHEDTLCLGGTILVVEDNEINQQVIKRQLALLGVEAEIVNNGHEAFVRWKESEFALLLTDVHMPDMDGYELTLAIRAEEKQAGRNRTPIIAFTANAMKGEAEYCRSIGMDDYLSKPVQFTELKMMLEKWQLPVEAADIKEQAMDVGILQKLVGSDPTVIDEILREFQFSATSIATELRIACEALHCDQASAAAHKLKSSARSVGALKLGALCERIEMAGKNGEAEVLNNLFSDFKVEMVAVENFLAQWLELKKGDA